MELRVRDKDGYVDLDFGSWLKEVTRIELISNIRLYDFRRWEKFINSLRNKTITDVVCLNDLIIFAANSLECVGQEKEIVIRFPSIYVPGFDKVPLNALLKTINYGTLDIKGCNIITRTFSKIEENILDYLKQYYHV